MKNKYYNLWKNLKSFTLSDDELRTSFGGGHLDNCIASIDGACSVSCGGGECSYIDCYMNQYTNCVQTFYPDGW